MINPANAGLLSRPGPSLMFPGAMGTGHVFSGFSTSTLLDAFHPDPRLGTAYAPVFVGPEGGRIQQADMRADLLEQNEVFAFQRGMTALFHDARRLVEVHQRFGGEDFPCRIPLAMTGGIWGIENFEEEGGQVAVDVRSKDKRVRAFRMQSPDVCQLGIGWHGEQASLKQGVSVSAKGEVRTEGYDFEFFDVGIRSLASRLSMEGRPGFEVVQALALLIYHSTQYDHDEIQSEPPEGSREVSKVEMILRDAQNPDWNVVSICWGNDDLYGECLTISLRRSSSQKAPALMPLVGPLFDTLWEGALNLIY